MFIITIGIPFSIILTTANAIEVSLEEKITEPFFNRVADEQGLRYWTG